MVEENINEQQIIEFLRQREQLLKEELRKIRATISVLDSSSSALGSILAAEAAAKKSSSIRTVVRKPLTPVHEYSAAARLDDKISYALTKLKQGYKEDIIAVMVENEPDLDMIKLQNAVGVRLSYLIKNDLIEGEKHGRKFYYNLAPLAS